MAKNEQAREWGAQLIRDVVNRARWKGGYIYQLAKMADVGAGSLAKVAELAGKLGFWLVIQPPEEDGTGRWYAMGGRWRDQLKAMVFHFWEREDAELIESGREAEIELIVRDTKLRRALADMGLGADSFTDWLKDGKVPTMESFCILALFEGFKIEWREIPKGEMK